MSIDTGATRRRSNFALAMTLAAAILLGALIANPYWLYPGLVWPDPFYYYGFIIDFVRTMKLEGGQWYLGSRLGWILPGVLANSLATPPVAYFFLHSLMFFSFILANFLILRTWMDPASSAIGTILSATSTQVLMVFSWPYTQAAALTYWVLALLIVPAACWYAAELYEKKGGPAWEATTVALLLLFGLVAVWSGANELVDRYVPRLPNFSGFLVPFGCLSIFMTGFLGRKYYRAFALAAIPGIAIANIYFAPGPWKDKIQSGREKRDILGLIGQCHEIVRMRAEDPHRQLFWGGIQQEFRERESRWLSSPLGYRRRVRRPILYAVRERRSVVLLPNGEHG